MKTLTVNRIIAIAFLAISLLGVTPIAIFAISYSSYFFQALPNPSLGVIMVGPVYDLFLLAFFVFFIINLVHFIKSWERGFEAKWMWGIAMLGISPFLFFTVTLLIQAIDSFNYSISRQSTPSNATVHDVTVYSILSTALFVLAVVVAVGYFLQKSKQKHLGGTSRANSNIDETSV